MKSTDYDSSHYATFSVLSVHPVWVYTYVPLSTLFSKSLNLLKITFFWHAMLFGLLDRNQCFGEILKMEAAVFPKLTNYQAIGRHYSPVNLEAAGFFERLTPIYENSRHTIP
jgi:hypothetical protein